MLPRYLPRIDWRSWRDWLRADSPVTAEDWVRFRASLGAELPPCHREFDSLRSGLVQYFSSLRRQVGAGSVVVSAQICRVVPLAIERAGLTVRYVDLGAEGPTPGAAEFAAAIDTTTVGVLVAPLYGHIQRDWSALLTALNGRILVLDMAQGLGLESRVAPLLRRADAAAYSFGMGKGIDTGGGLLLTRTEIESADERQRSKAMLAGPLLEAVVLNAAVRVGCYGLIVSRLDAADMVDQTFSDPAMGIPPDMCRLWEARLPRLLEEIALARARAQALGAKESLAVDLRDNGLCFDAEAAHLRQLIRVRDASRRDALVARLRAAGVDCAPAGEPLPDVPSAPERFPRAAAFRAETIRLPFLGRLSESQFVAFETKLDHAVAHCLR